MAFVDSLVGSSDADVVLVDRRHRPGGHWNDAYPFVRLHLPSATYGVNSRRLGNDELQQHGPEAGWYERASGAEVCDYFARVLDEQLVPTGRVRFLGMHEFLPGDEHRVVSRLTGETTEVTVRRRLVDATYLESHVPATHERSFKAAPEVRLVAVNDLINVADPGVRYTVIGGGKTGVDACLWLLENGVDPEGIRWIRPRDAWWLDRKALQPRDHVGHIIDGMAADLEALVGATSYEDLFARLEDAGRLIRIDPQVEPTMYHCGSISRHELGLLQQIRNVIRLGRVTRIERDRVLLQHGEVPASSGELFIDCSAIGLRRNPPQPIFTPDKVTLQPVQHCTPTFNAALLGYVEATRDDPADQNRLCPPNVYPDEPRDWLRMLATTLQAHRQWRSEPDLALWVATSRLNLLYGVMERLDDPRVLAAQQRYSASIKPAVARIPELVGTSTTW